MSLMERLDLALLVRFDAMVAWNRDRGRADQWRLALACLDMGLAIVVAAFVLRMADTRSLTSSDQVLLLVIGFFFGFTRARERRSIERLRSLQMGARQARIGEARLRQANLAIALVALPFVALMGDISDACLLAAVVVTDATFYFKAAEPPPPADRRERRLREATT